MTIRTLLIIFFDKNKNMQWGVQEELSLLECIQDITPAGLNEEMHILSAYLQFHALHPTITLDQFNKHLHSLYALPQISQVYIHSFSIKFEI